MEGGNADDGKKPASGEPLTFHSENIRDTKAKEKRAVFLKVEEEKGIKVAAKNLNKKISASLSDLRTTLNKPLTPERSEKKPRKPLSKKTLALLIAIPVLAAVGFGVYYLIKNPQLTDPSIAAYLTMRENFDEGYAAYQKLIAAARTPEQESELLVKRGYAMHKICGSKCAEMILEDILIAERISPSADSALLYYRVASDNNQEDAERWLETSKARGRPSGWWNLDIWNNNINGTTK